MEVQDKNMKNLKMELELLKENEQRLKNEVQKSKK